MKSKSLKSLSPKQFEINNFPDVLFNFRREYKVTKTKLSAKSKVSTQHIKLIEDGECSPTVSTLNKLVGAMGYKMIVNLVPFSPTSPEEDPESGGKKTI